MSRKLHLIKARSVVTGKPTKMYMMVDIEDIKRWQEGAYVQDALSYLSIEEREFLITGIEPEDQKAIFATDDQE